jgi:hypothetical protein
MFSVMLHFGRKGARYKCMLLDELIKHQNLHKIVKQQASNQWAYLYKCSCSHNGLNSIVFAHHP